MRWKSVALIFAIVLGTAGATLVIRDVLLDEPELGENGLQRTTRSVVLNEEREYTVLLPESYSSDRTRRYPVLYVLDGQSQAGHTAESAALMARIGVMPEVIIVGVSSMEGDRRDRDYTPPDMLLDTERAGGATGSGDRFLTFLRDEMIPGVERDYRTERPRMLAGWSRGGLFVTYSLLAAPALFDARFAHSPALWREGDLIVGQLERLVASAQLLEGFLFLSLGEKENEKMKAAFTHAIAVLEKRAPRTLRWRAVLSRDGVHETNPRWATPVGFCAFFAPAAEPGAPTCPTAGSMNREPGTGVFRSTLPCTSYLYIPDRGTRTASSSRSTSMSLVVPSDCAWKLVSTRCRSTGCANARMSS